MSVHDVLDLAFDNEKLGARSLCNSKTLPIGWESLRMLGDLGREVGALKDEVQDIKDKNETFKDKPKIK